MMRSRASLFFVLVGLGCSSPTSTGLILDGGVVVGGDAPVGGDTGPAVTPAYAGCTTGATCSAGTMCVAAIYTSNGLTASLCTASCASDCPAHGSGSAYRPACVYNLSTGVSQCYATCVSNADCAADTQCAVIPGTDHRLCVPIGSGPIVTPQPPAAYSACTPVGARCQSGTTCSGSMFTRVGASTGSLCTIACTSGNPAMCPGYVPGAAVQAVECAAPMGNPGMAQCVRLCNPANSNRDCAPYFTTCATVQMAAGTLSICVP